jgi:biotin-[acetyl-CoA-carboxylase] ligase BirA-like protein
MDSTASPDNQSEAIVFSSSNLVVHHLKYAVESTQDEIKRLLQDHDGTTNLAVIADDQQKGRGTKGRSWVASQGNLYMTCAIAMDLIPISKITMLPLLSGVVVAECLAPYCLPNCRPTLKWPNDVLVDQRKIAGILIENYRVGQHDWWLVGIGVNVQSHPTQLLPEAKDFSLTPRRATSLQEHVTVLPKAVELGTQIASNLIDSTLTLDKDPAAVLTRFKTWAEFGQSYAIRESGEVVTVVDLHHDGRLRVIGGDGRERLLVSDYLY